MRHFWPLERSKKPLDHERGNLRSSIFHRNDPVLRPCLFLEVAVFYCPWCRGHSTTHSSRNILTRSCIRGSGPVFRQSNESKGTTCSVAYTRLRNSFCHRARPYDGG